MKIASLIRPLPQWSAVAVTPGQQSVSVLLRWTGGEQDVTHNHSVASLKPLIIAIGLNVGETAALEFRENGHILGALRLTRWKSVSTITLYRVVDGDHHCLPWPWRGWHRWRQERAAERSRQAPDFRMEPADLQHLMICYICPRPVVLVSVSGAGHFNIFPMDLIGSVDGQVALALRTTNISIPVMRDEGRIVLSSLPAGMKTAAYDLSARHRAPLTDPPALPFATRPSSTLRIAAVADALRTRELAIRHAEELGSHIFFIADILSDEPVTEGPQLHHISGFYELYRRWRDNALPRA
jgi:flavin reductase (DIM6/NTAB) family NADH-FMN oxidoreductase RutF